MQYLKTKLIDLNQLDSIKDAQKIAFGHQAGWLIAFKENTFTEIKSNDYYQIFTDNLGKYVGIYFKEDLSQLPQLEGLILNKPLVKLYLFSYTDNVIYEDDYASYDNVRLENIPASILRIYQKINS